LKDNFSFFFCRRNIQDNTNFSCRFDGTPETADCPIIRIGYILDRLSTNRTALILEVNRQKKYIENKIRSFWIF
jgi:hypothetical protein